MSTDTHSAKLPRGCRQSRWIAAVRLLRGGTIYFLLIGALILQLCPGKLMAQVSRGGKPVSTRWRSIASPPIQKMPAIDKAALLREDSLESTKGVPLRFGAPFDVNLSTANSGLWETLPDGSRVWRLQIDCPGAYSINLIYDRFWLPPGGELFLYNGDQSMVLGAFTEANNKPHGQFATGLLQGDVCILEYHEPAGVTRPGMISIGRVVHAYRNLFNSQELKDAMDFGGSGSCNNNVNCPEGQPWQSEKKSLALITTQGGFRLCSGALVNNVRQDLRPYLLTANHCLGSEATWVFIFNYESPTCANINGPTWMSISGSTLRATNTASDFALLELSETPPDSFNLYYAGWSAVDVPSTSSVAIHHPDGDIKKISFDYQAAQSTSYLGTSSGNGSHWRIVQWDDGTTEPGSSGAPLFDQNHRIIGQLHGGYASCASLTSDWFGKFARSWTGGGTSSTRLKDWLDPDNSGVTTLDGRDGVGLFILHSPLPDTADTLSDFTVVATIYSRGSLLADSTLLHYNVDAVWKLDTLTPNGNPNEYAAVIPKQTPGTAVQYYLTAVNSLGDHDTTATVTFSIIGRRVDVAASALAKAGVSGDPLWFDAAIVNRGSLEDSYALSVTMADWSVEITDTFGYPLSSTPALLTGEAFPVRLNVIVGPSSLGDTDTLYLMATSLADASTRDSLLFMAISEGTPLSLPMAESFPGQELDPTIWAHGTFVAVTTEASNSPSPPYSLQLDGYPTGADTIVSRPIDLSSAYGAVLSYAFEDGGFGEPADSGDDLSVDYLDNNDQWQLLTVHAGAGPSMPLFDRRDILLPSAALHNRFRLRFRSVAQPGNFDNWFVDDILISVPQPPDIEVPISPVTKWLAPNDSSFGHMIIHNQGSGRLTGTLEFSPNAKRAGGSTADYTWKSSDEAGGPLFSWLNVSSAAVNVVDGLNDDNVIGPLNLGVSFPWFGALSSQVYIGSNGLVGFDWPGMESSANASLPGPSFPNGILALFWKDMDPDNLSSGNASVYFDTAGGKCVISFYVYPQYQAGAGGTLTAQIALYQDGSVLLQYSSIGNSFDVSNLTIGGESLDGASGFTISHASPYLHSTMAVRISPPENWFSLKSHSISIAPGSVDTVVYEFDASGLDTGLYTGSVTLTTNDPDESIIVIPIELSRPSVLPYICGDINNDHLGPNIVDLTFLVGYLFAGGPPPPVMESADVNNSGGNPNVVDIAYLVRYLFMGGGAPDCP